MKAAVSVLMVVMIGLVISAIAVRSGDRGVLVPPADARVESFIRELMTRRSDLAMRYLAETLRSRTDPNRLQQSYDRFETGLGGGNDVEARTVRSDSQMAEARAELIGRRNSRATLEFGLTWQRGAWRIVRLPPAW